MNGAVQTIQPIAYTPLPPASKMLGRALSFYAEHWHVILGIALIPILIAGTNILLGEYTPSLAILISVVAVVVGFLARLALLDAIVENGEPTGGVVGAYQKGWHILIPFAWISALMTITTLGGFFLFIVPGVLLSIWLSMSFYAFIIEGQRGVSALTASWHYVKGYWLPVFWRLLFLGIITGVIGLLIYLAAILPSFFAAIESGNLGAIKYARLGGFAYALFANAVASPITVIYAYILYQSLRAAKGAPPADEQTRLKKIVTIFIVIGIIGLLALLIFAGFFLSRLIPEIIAPDGRPNAALTPYPIFASLGVSSLLQVFFR